MPSQETSHVKALIAANLDAAIAARPGLTNRALGESIGKTEHQVWRWRNGRNTPETPTLIALADVLGVELAWFYTEHPELERAA